MEDDRIVVTSAEFCPILSADGALSTNGLVLGIFIGQWAFGWQ